MDYCGEWDEDVCIGRPNTSGALTGQRMASDRDLPHVAGMRHAIGDVSSTAYSYAYE
jgi:hypothetical protein